MPPFLTLPDFDVQGAQNSSHYEEILRRIDDVSRSAIQGYSPEDMHVGIRACIKATKEFNAAAWKRGEMMWVGMSSVVPPLLLVFFAALLSDTNVLPALSGPAEDDPEIPGSLFHPADPSKKLEVSLRLSTERQHAAEILADLCISFIYLHEIGHILCGHCGATQHLWGGEEVAEFDFAAPAAKKRAEWIGIRQYWEYQADSVAASLLCKYIHLMVNDERNRQWLLKVAGTDDMHMIRIHAAALVNMAVSALFFFMAGCRLKNGAPATHPHPIVRSLYVKDMIAGRLGDDWKCDPREIGDLQFLYLEPFAFVLERMGLGSMRDWSSTRLARMEREGLKLASASKYRRMTQPWSWLPETEWQG